MVDVPARDERRQPVPADPDACIALAKAGVDVALTGCLTVVLSEHVRG